MTTINNQNNQAIGVFDSGVGGISVLKHLTQVLPNEHYIYVADSLNAPYGNKSAEFICARSLAISQFLLQQPVKAIVLACNTATAAAATMLREHYPEIPIIAMEPAIKPAVAVTKSGVIGVMATSGTLQSAQFAALLESYGQSTQVVTQACQGLVECIEQGALEELATAKLIQHYLEPLLQAGADTIVLGCTHYPFLKKQIQALAGETIHLIDTGQAVAKQLQHRLQQADLLSTMSHHGKVSFYSNSPHSNAQQVIARLWGAEVSLQHLSV